MNAVLSFFSLDKNNSAKRFKFEESTEFPENMDLKKNENGTDYSDEEEMETETESETESEEVLELDPWRHSVFGCCDHGAAQCCVMTFCGWCVYGNAINSAFHQSNCCYFCCCLFGEVFCCCNRAKIRARYGLEEHNLGGVFGDCLTVTCCPCCARCQQVLEIETREGIQIGCCGKKRGDPRRTQRAANTGGGMSRAKIAPLDENEASSAEKQPLHAESIDNSVTTNLNENYNGSYDNGGMYQVCLLVW